METRLRPAVAFEQPHHLAAPEVHHHHPPQRVGYGGEPAGGVEARGRGAAAGVAVFVVVGWWV